MDKEKAQKILAEIVDGETSELEKEEFASYLKTDVTLKALFGFESKFRSFVAERDTSEKLPDSARSKIMAQLDAIDAEDNADRSTQEYRSARAKITDINNARQPFSFRYSVAVAASFVLMLLGGFATVSFFRHQNAFGAFENAHHLDNDIVGAINAGRLTADASEFIQEKFGVEVAPKMDGLELCGGEVVKFDNNEFAHFKYCDIENRPVSIFVGSAADYELPEMPSTIQAGKEYFNHVCHGCELMFWISGKALIVAATDPHHMDDRPISSLVSAESELNLPDSNAGDEAPKIH